ncbi:MAG: adenylyltransferase/cytidyltransferase family protein [Bacteroidales bacterium]|nr:adenylyltransferase/cytidyltransferase family protein [Bacteroidales bacterium]
MKIFKGFEEARGIRNPVVTTGSFDGVHIGHKTILNRLRLLAEKYDGESVLITFDPHPRKVLYPDSAGKNLKLINSQEEKLELLRKAGLDNLIIIEFTKEFSKITSEEFVRDILKGILGAKVIVAGFNHHFGFNQEGDYRKLWLWREKYNFEAEEIPEQEVQHEAVSSTKIRKAISEGYIQRANAYLDHYYIIMGKPESYGYENSQYPIKLYKIPVSDESKLLPAPGIYAVSAEAGPVQAKCMAIINPKNENEQEVLIHMIEKDYLPYGLTATLYFHKKIHGSIDLNDHKTSAIRLKTAKREISELIY